VPNLVIFDCDGVLVDSELIFARLLAERLTAVDFPTTIDEAITLGFGKNRTTLSAAVAAQFGRALPDAFFDTFAARSAAAGMPVVGFCGGGHCPDGHADRLIAAGCSGVFAKMPDLAAFLHEERCG
jgi:beta-phosphoglucomutase-like phosphatase (HAD superfamily)